MIYPRVMYPTRRFGGTLLGLALLGIAALGYTPVQAALVTGSMGLTGSFVASGGTDLSNATLLDLGSATGASGSGDIGSTVGFGTSGTVNNSPFTFNPSTAVTNLLQIGGWQIDIGTSTIVDQTTSLLNLQGTGTISGNGFALTSTQWSLSANSTGSSYSMTVSAVPVPAALWLLGSGLMFIGGVARRKTR